MLNVTVISEDKFGKFPKELEAYADETDITNLSEYVSILLSLSFFLQGLMSPAPSFVIFFTFFQFEFVLWLKSASMYQTILILQPKYKEQ